MRQGGQVFVATSGLLVALLTLGPPPSGYAATTVTPGWAACSLSLASDPPGAMVYVNGEPRGETPLRLEEEAGTHRVRLVKSGYFENSRVVRLRAGEASRVEARLTPDPSGAPAAQVEETQEKKGGNKKPLLIGAGILGAAAVAYLALRDTNKPPVAALTVDAGGTALMGATAVSFNGGGSSDPDGDALTYSWNFGDGTSGTGQTTTHVYNSAGSFSVTLMVSDGKKSATANGSVTVASVTGTWDLAYSGAAVNTFTLTQSGRQITGTWNFQGPRATVTGSASASRHIQVAFVSPFNLATFTFIGTGNQALSMFTGSLTGSNGFNSTSTITRR
jgi:hypothetical protein